MCFGCLAWAISLYNGGCAKYKVEGSNLGYAVHCYCGWYGSDAEADSGEGIGTSTGGGYTTFQQGWDKQVKPVTDIAPIMVTEMDWALSKYNSSWGKGNYRYGWCRRFRSETLSISLIIVVMYHGCFSPDRNS